MEILLNQRFSYARIDLLKDYCNLKDKAFYKREKESKKVFPSINMDSSQCRNKNVLFYSIPDSEEKEFDLFNFNPSKSSVFEHACSSITINSDKIKKYYNNPFAQITVRILERSIVKRGSKIIVTESFYQKHRDFNYRFFRKSEEKNKFSFDFETGNFQVIQITGAKKLSKIFRTNNFLWLKNFTNNGDSHLKLERWLKTSEMKSFPYWKEYNTLFNDTEYYNTLGGIFGLDPFEFSPKKRNNLYAKIMELFVKHRKIGIPDHSYQHFLEYNYPTEKYFKKNDRKLIASVLDYLGIKSKINIKIFHKHPYLDINAFRKLCILLGDNYTKYIGSIPDKVFSASQARSTDHYRGEYYTNFIEKVKRFDIKEKEKENLIKVLSDDKNLKPLYDNLVEEIYDHFHMIHKIRPYDENVGFKARSHAEFHSEHMEFSKLMSAVKKGWVMQYFYEDKTIAEIEEPLKVLDVENVDNEKTTFYPHILKREEEYVEEGAFMHHCVATYANKDTSIIISIRNVDKTDRLTCEFNIQTGKLVQARHFCNAQAPDRFLEALVTIEDKVRLMARFGTLNWKEKKKVPLKINGKEIQPALPEAANHIPFF